MKSEQALLPIPCSEEEEEFSKEYVIEIVIEVKI
jgi:hypothetical protein